MTKRPPKKSEMGTEITPAINHKFAGTDNPRHLRAIAALLRYPVMRKDLDNVAGCINGPQLISELRDLGLKIPCKRISHIDRDGKCNYPGQYYFTESDKHKLNIWNGSRQNGSIDFNLLALISIFSMFALPLMGAM